MSWAIERDSIRRAALEVYDMLPLQEKKIMLELLRKRAAAVSKKRPKAGCSQRVKP